MMCREINSQWYFDTGAGMSEDTSVFAASCIDASGYISQDIAVPAGCRHLRWDPCEQPCMVINALFAADDGRILAPAASSGIPTADGFVFYDCDPQITLDFEEPASKGFNVNVSAEFRLIEDEYAIRAFRFVGEWMAREKNWHEEQKYQRKSKRLLSAVASSLGHGEGSGKHQPDSGALPAEALRIVRRLMAPPEENGLFVPYRTHGIAFRDGDVKPIAFYLPQYHAIPENDEWWGKGFTEWDNVVTALPSFDGHYQPHLPYDVGFYDLSHIDVMKRQVELAKNYGVYGFCFYYYRFGKKRMLEKPLENFLAHKEELDFPFCVCWANENWSRRWDGHDKDVILGQDYSDGGNTLCIEDMAGYFADRRYIRFGGKPLVIIYRGNEIPNIHGMLESWRGYCRDAGVGEIVVAGCAMDGIKDPLAFGFDIGIDFTPNNIMRDLDIRTLQTFLAPYGREYHLYDMQPYLDRVEGFLKQREDMLCTVFPAWDNTARRKTGAYIYPLSPGQYGYWLKKCIEATAASKSPDRRFVFINAWNEWAEGAHLEPDRRYGYAYLEATAEAVSEMGQKQEGLAECVANS